MIVVSNLWKGYGKLQVIKGMNLVIDDGITLVILGRSGVGKSVLLKHIIGLEKPDQGEVKVGDKVVTALNGSELYGAIRGMGMLFQGAALFDSMNVEDNTAFYLIQHGAQGTGDRMAKSEVQDRVAEALRMVGLEDTQKKMPSDLSGGMRKRAALARLIIYKPKILLYDEPTTGLDPITAKQISDLIRQIQYELKATSIVVTHDMVSAFTVADKLAVQNHGRIAHVADKETFLTIDDPLVKDFLEMSQSPRRRWSNTNKDG